MLPASLSLRQRGVVTFLTWLAMVGFDFFLHAGLLSRLYTQSSPFLLTPDRAFALIPFGYASFLLLAIAMVWLVPRLGIRRASAGFLLGLQLGSLLWGALVLGLASISTASPVLLVGWFIGQTLELALGGAVVGSAIGGTGLRTLAVRVVVFTLGSFILTVALQNLGFAAAAKVLVSQP